jgi:hypothetical protein
VLWEQGPLAFAARALPDTRTPRVGKQPYFHAGMLAEVAALTYRRGGEEREPAFAGSLGAVS